MIGDLKAKVSPWGAGSFTEENLANLQKQLILITRKAGKLEDADVFVKLSGCILPALDPLWSLPFSNEEKTPVLVACIVLLKALPIELFKALIDAGVPTHGVKAKFHGMPLFWIAIDYGACLSVAQFLLKNEAAKDVPNFDDHFSLAKAVLSKQGSEEDKVAMLNSLYENGLNIRDRSGNTELHRGFFSKEIAILLRVSHQRINQSLYQANDQDETPWEVNVKRAADCDHWASACKTRYLSDAQTLIRAMDPKEILSTKTINYDGSEGPTQFERLQHFVGSNVLSSEIKEMLAYEIKLIKMKAIVEASGPFQDKSEECQQLSQELAIEYARPR